MGRGAPKAQGNVWYHARRAASIRNEKLSSRFGAAEEMGLSEDAVKSAELGLYKSICPAKLRGFSCALQMCGLNA